MKVDKVIVLAGGLTTYDFRTKTFGHATMLVEPWQYPELDAALDQLKEQRQQITEGGGE